LAIELNVIPDLGKNFILVGGLEPQPLDNKLSQLASLEERCATLLENGSNGIAIPTTGANPSLLIPQTNQLFSDDMQREPHVNLLVAWFALDELVNGRWHQ
jgi:hypothetical protein